MIFTPGNYVHFCGSSPMVREVEAGTRKEEIFSDYTFVAARWEYKQLNGACPQLVVRPTAREGLCTNYELPHTKAAIMHFPKT